MIESCRIIRLILYPRSYEELRYESQSKSNGESNAGTEGKLKYIALNNMGTETQS